MHKIPVFETVAHAYGFAIGRFLRILGIVWAPLAVSIAVGLMAMPGFMGNHIPIDDVEAIQRNALHITPFVWVFSLFIRAMIGVGVTELALGKRTGTTFVYFSLAAPVWRLIGAWLLFLLAMIVIYFGIVVLTLIISIAGAFAVKALALAKASEDFAFGIWIIICLALFFGALIYVMARLAFLIPPVVVNENKIDLARGWELTRGSFWRIFCIGFAIFVPLIVVQIVVVIAVYGAGFLHQFAGMMHAVLTQHATEEAMKQQMEAWSLAVRARSVQVWPIMAGFALVFETFAYGLLYGASAFAYREVTPESVPPASGPQ
jgi:hypothetical protein